MTKVTLPREVAIDRLLAHVNGTQVYDPTRPGFMSRERAGHALDLFKSAFGNAIPEYDFFDRIGKAHDGLAKAVTVATGLTYYDLRAPALNLFPTVTPLRNAIPRMQRKFPGDSAHWKSVLATVGSGFPYMGWVPEGKRSASMSYTVQNNMLAYATLGEEDSLTDEARFAAMGFEDEDSLVQLRLLLKMFVKEEIAILGGNSTPNNNGIALGTPTTATLSAGGSGNTLPAATYSVIVAAMTLEGYMNSSLAGGVSQTIAITGNDGNSYTLNGGSSNRSASSTIAVSAGQALSATVPAITGAVAYAWFVGPVGSETLQQITTINSMAQTTALVAGQPATAITADCSGNSIAFNGLLTTAFNAGNNAYVKVMANGTAGTGTPLTASGVGSVSEIDTMLKTMWDTYRVSPTVIYVNSQELKNITAKVLTNSTSPLLRYNVSADEAGNSEYKLTAAGVIAYYFNPYTADGGIKIPVKIHPNLPPGTLIAWAEKLPPWYISNEVPEVAVIQTRQDYYTEVWPKTTRTQFYGVYSQEVLAVYAPFSMGVITNIGNG